jgi:uncharacterized protein YdeI (YjbR/CyaY-like superfamily)
MLVLLNNSCFNIKTMDPFPTLSFESPAFWEAWLQENHARVKGIWLKIAKKDAGIPTVDYAGALDGALCYGWIDGQKAPFDGQYWLQKFTPRRPKSNWSKVNCQKAEALSAAGRMQPAGLLQMELAKADGRWDAAYDSQSKISVPEDFQQALDDNPPAQEFFLSLNSADRYSFLYRLQTVKKAETRQANIQKFCVMLAEHKKFHL